MAWLILPAVAFRRSIREALFCGWQRMKYFGAPMLLNYLLGGTKRGHAARLARKTGIDAAALRATIAAHDAAIMSGAPDAVGKTEELRRPIDLKHVGIEVCHADQGAIAVGSGWV